jgi:hypothetical protein
MIGIGVLLAGMGVLHRMEQERRQHLSADR